MDPVTHALVGLGIAGLSGQPLNLADPVYLGACLGAMAPDLDIVYQLKGDVAYLKHHRGFSHSLPGIVALSSGIALLLHLFYPGQSLWIILFWTLLGTLSHGIMDIFNSYGAKMLWPLSNKKLTLNLLNAVDPVIIITLLLTVCGLGRGTSTAYGLILIAGYIGMRRYIALRLQKRLRAEFDAVKKVTVMPSLVKFWCWDCLVETGKTIACLEVNSFTGSIKVKRELPKEQHGCSVIQLALDSKLGKMFREFTPHFHVFYRPWQQGYLVKFLDLRYCLKQDFLHSATILINPEQELYEQIFHPYHKNRNIKITG